MQQNDSWRHSGLGIGGVLLNGSWSFWLLWSLNHFRSVRHDCFLRKMGLLASWIFNQTSEPSRGAVQQLVMSSVDPHWQTILDWQWLIWQSFKQTWHNLCCLTMYHRAWISSAWNSSHSVSSCFPEQWGHCSRLNLGVFWETSVTPRAVISVA